MLQEHIPQHPSKVLVSFSGGKDSVAALLASIETYGKECVIGHHQVIVEDWPGTVEYCQQVCDLLGVPLYTSQALYYGYECDVCKGRFLSAIQVGMCKKCKKASGLRQVATITGLVDLMWWREMWPSSSIRFCTSYLKRDVLNKWIIRNRELLGHRPILVMGERWLESPHRAQLLYIRKRSGVQSDEADFVMLEWHAILAYRRIDAFCACRAAGIRPHYCYHAQGMTDYEMYELDVEGGARMSCRCCFYKSLDELLVSALVPGNECLFDELERFEAKTGHTIRQGVSIASIRAGRYSLV